MCWYRWAGCLLLGGVFGGGIRWIVFPTSTATDHRLRVSAIEELHTTASVSGASLPSSPIPNATVEDLCRARGATFLDQLIPILEQADGNRLQELLLAFKVEDRLDTVTKDLLFLRWMEIDPASALEAAARQSLLNSAYWAWAKVDPEAALAHVKELGNPKWLAAVIRAIGQDDPERGLKLTDEWLVETDRGSALRGILASIGHTDPARALGIALEVDQWDPEIAQEWLRKDPVAAFDWMLTNVPSHESYSWRRAIEGLFKSHPPRVNELIQKIPEGWLKLDMASLHLSHLAYENLEEALTNLEDASKSVADYQRSRMAEHLLTVAPDQAFRIMSEIDWNNPPPNAAGISAKYPGGGSGAGEEWAALSTISRSAMQDPERTAAFLETLPESPLTNKAYQNVTERWMRTDALGASQWIGQLRPGALKDQAITSMTGELIRKRSPDRS